MIAVSVGEGEVNDIDIVDQRKQDDGGPLERRMVVFLRKETDIVIAAAQIDRDGIGRSVGSEREPFPRQAVGKTKAG